MVGEVGAAQECAAPFRSERSRRLSGPWVHEGSLCMYACDFSAGPWGWLGMVLWWGAVVLAVVWFVRSLGGGRGPGTPAPARAADPALQILRERYARGEIDTEEFDRRRVGLD